MESKRKITNSTSLTLPLILFCLMLSIATSCGASGEDEPNSASSEYLNVTNQISISSEGNLTATLEIKADCSWTITGKPSWMTLSANSGNGNASITITCTPNPSSEDERSAVLTVTSASGKINRQVTVTQPVSTEFITTNTMELEFDAISESKILSITSNTKWTIQGIDDWISLSRDKGEGNTDITVTVSKNESENTRKATLTIQGTHVSTRVAVSQDGKSTVLSISPTTINATAIGNSYNLTVEGDATWTASTNASWVTLSKSTGTGDAVISIKVADNETTQDRQAEITFITSKNTYICSLVQQAAKLPQVNETTITNIEKYSAKAHSSFESEFIVLDCGFCYSTINPEPTINDNIAPSDETDSSEFTTHITGLKSGKKYYIRGYAKSTVGIGYGPVKEITTKGDIPGSDDNPTPDV